METFKIKRVDATDEVLAKLMNSAAEQHDCRVDYEPDTDRVTSNCGQEVKPVIVNQVAAIFGIQPDS